MSGRLQYFSLESVVDHAPIIVVATGAKPGVTRTEISYPVVEYREKKRVTRSYSGDVLRFRTVEVLKGGKVPDTITVVDAELALRFELDLRSVRDGVNKIPFYDRYETSVSLPSLEAIEGRTLLLFLRPPPAEEEGQGMGKGKGRAAKDDPATIFRRAFGAHHSFSIVPGYEDVSRKAEIVRLIGPREDGDPGPLPPPPIRRPGR